MVVAIRNMTRCIWVNINVEDYDKGNNGNNGNNTNKVITDKERTEHLLEKKTAINLLLGFAIATKHYLREEPVKFVIDSNTPGVQIVDINKEDHFPETSEASNTSNGTFSDTSSGTNGTFSGKFMKNIKKLLPSNSHSKITRNLPYDLTLYLSSYVRKQKMEGTTDDATISALYANLGTLTDCLSTFERILRSPIPLAYAIHLTQVTWIYCLILPFQLVQDLEWLAIPITFLITMTLFGVEKIAGEIENPFGWDENDLDLDGFCGLLNRELNNVTSEAIPPVSEWIFTKENIPFGSENISALQASNFKLDEVKNLLNRESLSGEKPAELNIEIEKDDNENNNNNNNTVVS
jgi:putative membrane protein